MNKKSSKLLAAVAVFAMVACAFAIIPAGDVEATDYTAETGTASMSYGENTEYYGTLAEAWYAGVSYSHNNSSAAVTVTLLKESSGYGLGTYDNYNGTTRGTSVNDANVTLDLNGKKYTITESPIGSTGTMTQGMQLLEKNTITLKNGTLTSESGSGVLWLINNYAKLEIQNVTLDGSNLDDSSNSPTITVNVNNDTVTITGGKIIDDTAPNSFGTYAVRVNDADSYKGNATATIGGTGNKVEIEGNILVTGNGDAKAVLDVVDATIGGEIVCGNGTVVEITIAEGTGVNVSVPNGNTITGTVAFGTNKATFSKIKAGASGITISEGSVEISGTMDVSEVESEIESATGDVVLKNLTIIGSDSDDTLNINVDVKVEGTVVISENVVVTTGPEKAITVEEGAALNIAGNAKNAKVVNSGTVVMTSAKATLPTNMSGTGTVDTSSVQEEATLSGNLYTSTTFDTNQTVTLSGDTTLVENTILTIKGTLIIPEGVTLTLSGTSALWITGSAAKLENNGEIVIESTGQFGEDNNVWRPNITAAEGDDRVAMVITASAYVENNGTISAVSEIDGAWFEGCYNIYIKNAKMVNNGTIEVAEGNAIGVDVTGETTPTTTIQNSVDGIINIEGVFIGYIANSGTVTVDGFFHGFVNMTASDAVVDVVSLKKDGVGPNYWHDVSMEIDTLKMTNANGDELAEDAKVVLGTVSDTATEYGLKGITVTSKIVTELDDKGKIDHYDGHLVLSGDVDYNLNADTDETKDIYVKMSLYGLVDVDTTLAVGEFVGIEVSVDEEIAKTLVTIAGEMALDSEKDDGYTIANNNAGFKVTGMVTAFYALDTNGLDASHYEIKGGTSIPDQYIYTSFASALEAAPAEITVYGDLVVESEISIPSPIKVKATNVTVKADGILTVKDGAKLTAEKATVLGALLLKVSKNSKITTIDSDVSTTNDKSVLYSGLTYALKNASEGDVIKISRTNDVKIEKDITIPAGVTLDTNVASGIIINEKKTLTIDGTLFLNKGIKMDLGTDSEVVLNGIIKSTAGMTDSGIAGAYYQMMEKGVFMYFIEPVANAAPKAATVYDGKISIYGELNVGDISFTGTEDVAVTVEVMGKLTAGTITIDNATVGFPNEVKFKGTIADANGSIVLDGTAGAGFEVASAVDADGVDVLSISGKFAVPVTYVDKDFPKIEGNLRIVGNVTVLDESGFNYATVDGTLTVDGTVSIGMLVINGTVNVPANDVLNSKIIEVFGILAAADTDDGDGKVNVDGLFVGTPMSDVLDPTTLYASSNVLAGTGTVSGDVSLNTAGFAIVTPGSTIPESFTDGSISGLKAVDFTYNNTTLYTAYVMPGCPLTFGNLKANVDNVYFTGWDGATGPVINYDRDSVKAEVETDIYLVKITVCDGVTNVMIDGQLLTKSENYWWTYVAAGQHTVGYALQAGYGGEATLVGKDVSGMTFTTQGVPESFDSETGIGAIEYDLQLTGITVKEAASAAGMSLTEILLIVLVVLIAVMAIVIAMRMMRS